LGLPLPFAAYFIYLSLAASQIPASTPLLLPTFHIFQNNKTYKINMATLMAPSSSFNPVKVDVRLCGSVPRQELEALSLRKFTPQPNLPSRTPNTNPYLVERDGDFSFSSHHTIEDEKMAMQLSSQLSNQEEMHHYHYRNATSRPSLPEFEAPTWAVPAMGESRLEVSMELGPLHAFFSRSFRNSQYLLVFVFSLSATLK
jgi:hypothetical protein